MCLFNSLLRTSSKSAQAKFASSKRHSRPVQREPQKTTATRAPLPQGFDATKANTFLSASRIKAMGSGSQETASLNDAPPLLQHSVSMPLEKTNSGNSSLDSFVKTRRAVTFAPTVTEHCPINGKIPDRAHNLSFSSDHYSTTARYM